MDYFIALRVIALICYCIYRHGKLIGSCKGYGAGRARAVR